MKRFIPLVCILILVGGIALGFMLRRGDAGFVYDSENALHSQFSGENAYRHVQAMVEMGPRVAGTEGAEECRLYLEKVLHELGWATARQTFTEATPHGDVTFVNLRARFPADDFGDVIWNRPFEGIICSHYDTKFYNDFEFVGANDSGSSTGALLEIARIAASQPDFARRLELIFFDGEEAFLRNINAQDGLYGSRYYARKLRVADKLPRFGVLLDMIGDIDLNVELPSDTPGHLRDAVLSAANDLGVRRHFGMRATPIIDDHIPLNAIGIPTVDIIDLDYRPWHTAGDRLDKVSAQSIEIVGQTAVLVIEKYLLPES